MRWASCSAEDAAADRLKEMKSDTLGARHRALVAVAGNNPECPVIAVSVDGGFAAALKDASREEVLVWKFKSWDWDAEDPFDPQPQAIWVEMLEAAGEATRSMTAPVVVNDV